MAQGLYLLIPKEQKLLFSQNSCMKNQRSPTVVMQAESSARERILSSKQDRQKGLKSDTIVVGTAGRPREA